MGNNQVKIRLLQEKPGYCTITRKKKLGGGGLVVHFEVELHLTKQGHGATLDFAWLNYSSAIRVLGLENQLSFPSVAFCLCQPSLPFLPCPSLSFSASSYISLGISAHTHPFLSVLCPFFSLREAKQFAFLNLSGIVNLQLSVDGPLLRVRVGMTQRDNRFCLICVRYPHLSGEGSLLIF